MGLENWFGRGKTLRAAAAAGMIAGANAEKPAHAAVPPPSMSEMQEVDRAVAADQERERREEEIERLTSEFAAFTADFEAHLSAFAFVGDAEARRMAVACMHSYAMDAVQRGESGVEALSRDDAFEQYVFDQFLREEPEQFDEHREALSSLARSVSGFAKAWIEKRGQ